MKTKLYKQIEGSPKACLGALSGLVEALIDNGRDAGEKDTLRYAINTLSELINSRTN